MALFLAAVLFAQTQGDLIINQSIEQVNQSIREQNRILREQEQSRKIDAVFNPSPAPTIVVEPPKPEFRHSPLLDRLLWEDWPKRKSTSPVPVPVQDNTGLYVLAGAIVLAAGLIGLAIKPFPSRIAGTAVAVPREQRSQTREERASSGPHSLPQSPPSSFPPPSPSGRGQGEGLPSVPPSPAEDPYLVLAILFAMVGLTIAIVLGVYGPKGL